jgi:sugar/nucleoside kinase (ribokinase family)
MRAHSYVTPELIEKNIQILANSDLVAIDADIPKETISYICNFCSNNNIPVWYNPTDLRKCNKIVETNNLTKITYLSPNQKELVTLFQSTYNQDKFNKNEELKRLSLNYENNLKESLELKDLKEILKYLLDFVPFIILSRGSQDLIFASKYDLDLNETNQLPIKTSLMQEKVNLKEKKCIITFPILELNRNEEFVNVSGAGDSCSSGIMSGIINNYTFSTCIYNGLICAKYALMTRENVSSNLDKIELNYLKKLAESNKSNIKKIYLD